MLMGKEAFEDHKVVHLWDGGLQVVVFIQELQQLLGGSVNGQLVWFNSLLLQHMLEEFSSVAVALK